LLVGVIEKNGVLPSGRKTQDTGLVKRGQPFFLLQTPRQAMIVHNHSYSTVHLEKFLPAQLLPQICISRYYRSLSISSPGHIEYERLKEQINFGIIFMGPEIIVEVKRK
jgi:hypothetical protein